MNLEEFWKIIEVGSKSQEPEAILEVELNKLDPQEIQSFQEHFDRLFDSAYKWNLWGAAYIIGGGCSDDAFMDFRYGLISLGKPIFENALKDPDSLSEVGTDTEIENESYGYVAQEVYESKTGKEIPRIERSPEADDSMGEEWDFDDEEENKKRLPKLMEIYW